MPLRFTSPALYLMDTAAGTRTALKVSDASATLDESAVPWGSARVTLNAVTDAVYAILAPGRTDYYLSLEVAGLPAETTRGSFQCIVTDRTRDAFGVVQLTLTTPDIRLTTYSPATTVTAPMTMQSNVWDIWRFVLGQVFGSAGWLQIATSLINSPSSLVIPYPTFRAASNMIANPGFESGTTTGWTPIACTASAVSGSWSSTGTWAIRLFPNTTNANSYVYTTVNVEPNTTYTVSATLRVGQAMTGTVSDVARRILITGAVNGQGYELARSVQGAQGTNATTRLSRTFTTPAVLDSNQVAVRLYHGQTSSGFVGILWDDVLMVEGNGIDTDGVNLIPYFDGDTANGTGGYNYAWEGTAKASTATRTPIVDRDPDTLVWSPGQSAYDFLTPILQASGLRSFAYPLFLPTTTGPNGNYVPTFVLADNQAALNQQPLFVSAGSTLFSSSVLSSLTAEFSDGTPMFADAVTIKYIWTDPKGNELTAFDTYAPAGYTKPYYLEQPDTPYPGPGRAKYLYTRLNARRQMLEVLAPLNGVVLPGAQIIITDPVSVGPTPVVAYVETVDHDYTAGTSRIRTKAAIDYPNSAWQRLPAGEAWTASPTGASWTAETVN